uniref:Large ribosomal subunit protein uL4c n=1 Tax=Bostrychia tenella TaxID=324755 RepID=A0A1Z1M689_9FLOR|nr:ribosomal protein L4 [Bostrychia tenella]ARW61285.1 ribosomal protein L4 [Bostrychia tenella]
MSIIKQVPYSIKSIEKNKPLDSQKKVYLNILNDESKQMYIVHRSLKQQLTSYRVRNAHTKTRTEVKGGGKKPWKQKGTGRARAGSTRSPLWKGGGIIFGPRKKTYKSKINKKEKKLAIQIVIYNKFSNTIIVDKLLNNITKPSTKNAITELNKLGINTNNNKKVLLILEKKTKVLHFSFRNIPNIEIIKVNNLNVLSLLKADRILITVNALNIISKINN